MGILYISLPTIIRIISLNAGLIKFFPVLYAFMLLAIIWETTQLALKALSEILTFFVNVFGSFFGYLKVF